MKGHSIFHRCPSCLFCCFCYSRCIFFYETFPLKYNFFRFSKIEDAPLLDTTMKSKIHIIDNFLTGHQCWSKGHFLSFVISRPLLLKKKQVKNSNNTLFCKDTNIIAQVKYIFTNNNNLYLSRITRLAVASFHRGPALKHL